MQGRWAMVLAPGLVCSPERSSCSGPIPFPGPAPPEGVSNPRLACQPAPCPLACSCSPFGCSGFPPQSGRRRQAQGGGATPGLGFLQPMPSSPGRPPGGGPSSQAPRSTVMAHGEGRTQGRTRAPSSLSLPPARLSPRQRPSQARRRWRPLPAPKGQRMEARASSEPAVLFLGAPPGPRESAMR